MFLCEKYIFGFQILWWEELLPKWKKANYSDIAFTLVSGLILTALDVLLIPSMLMLVKTDPEVLPEPITYFRWYFILVLKVVLYNSFSGILQAVGNSLILCYF